MATENTKSAVERAREFGIDISLTEQNLRRTPLERLKRLQEWMEFAEELRRSRERDLSTIREAKNRIDIEKALRLLNDNQVEFIIVGEVAATYHGLPHVTNVLDICYRRNRLQP